MEQVIEKFLDKQKQSSSAYETKHDVYKCQITLFELKIQCFITTENYISHFFHVKFQLKTDKTFNGLETAVPTGVHCKIHYFGRSIFIVIIMIIINIIFDTIIIY